jgi:hypothetical protein
MGPRRLDTEAGATRLELAVAAILAALLAGLLLDRLIAYHGESERVAAKQLIGSLRTALAVREYYSTRNVRLAEVTGMSTGPGKHLFSYPSRVNLFLLGHKKF